MRKQTRPPEPKEFQENSAKWNAQWAELRDQNPSAQFKWYKIGKTTARDWALPALREMNQGHCSFCDAFPLEDRIKIPIEHFKPKSRPEFYGEAYAWSNLYYCCGICQAFKEDSWDDRLIRPDGPGYEFLKYFEFDYTTGAIRPSLLAHSDDQARAATTIEIYGLDHKTKRRERLRSLRIFSRGDSFEIDDFAYRDFLEGG